MVSWSNNFETADLHPTRLYLYFLSFFKVNMSDPRPRSSLICGCSKYICETAGNRLNQDNNHLRPSRGLTDDFFVDGLLLPFILEGVEVVTEFHMFDLTTFVMSFRIACRKAIATRNRSKNDHRSEK